MSINQPAVPKTDDTGMEARFHAWFEARGWRVRDYQRQMIRAYRARESTLLIAPTGAGKTLAGFLPALLDLAQRNQKPDGEARLETQLKAALQPKLRVLYISPLRALTNDIERNLTRPITDMDLPIRLGVRTGDTKAYQRKKQRENPPDILMTTPESLMLLLSYPDAKDYFSDLDLVIIDELHSFATNKRGDFTALALARLKTLAPQHVRFGLSATISDPASAARWLGPTGSPAKILEVKSDQKPEISLLVPDTKIPLGGHNSRYAVKDIYAQIKTASSVIVFVNTRAQAEMLFQELWQVNCDNLPIGVYHGSLSRDRRELTEKHVSEGKLRALVSTSALEMGIDWGNIDLILQVSAPKGVSRLLQRIGRSNHRMDEPSKAKLVPTNPLEAVECVVAMEAIQNGHRDGEEYRDGALDVVIQFIVNCSCSDPICPDELFAEISSASAFSSLKRADFDKLLQFAVDGGYALKSYERFHRLSEYQGAYRIASQAHAHRHRMNIGTIVEYAKLKVRRLSSPKSKRGRVVGEIEERFVMNLNPGDTFIFAGEVLRFQGVRDMAIEASPAPKRAPKVPAFAGGMMPLSTYLADGVRRKVSNARGWGALPPQIQEWLAYQKAFSRLPDMKGVLVETFPDRGEFVTVFHTFEGRKVNQALGFLLTKRMEALGMKPLTFSITDYALTITSLDPVHDIETLLEPSIVEHELQDWIHKSPMVKRAFRKIATIAGLTEQRLPGVNRSMKQVTFSTDLIYDVLVKYDPDHILLRISREEAERDQLDIPRLKTWLSQVCDHITFITLPHASPLAIPSMLQLGRERILGEGEAALLERELSQGEVLLQTIKDSLNAPNHQS